MSTTPARAGQHLVIDVGNTRSKAGSFMAGRCVRTLVLDTGDTSALTRWLGGDRVDRIVLGAVAAVDDWLPRLKTIAPVALIRGDGPSPLKSRYTTMATLGVDRLAGAVAAQRMFPDRPVLVISLGTCITLDLLLADGVHAGGAISPGMRMRSRGMNAFTARLPETDLDRPVEALGTNTQGSLLAGIHHGIRFELQGWIDTLRQQHARLAVVLTGGDAVRFSRALKSGIFADPSLTLRGLHALLPYASDPDGPAAGAAGG